MSGPEAHRGHCPIAVGARDPVRADWCIDRYARRVRTLPPGPVGPDTAHGREFLLHEEATGRGPLQIF